MFRFANPDWLYLLVVVPVLIAVFIYGRYRQGKRLRVFGNPELLRTLMPNVSYVRPHVKFYLVLLVVILIIFALARPQFGSKLETHHRRGVEVMIALDVSKSMLARDIMPNRLEYAKMILSKMIDQMHNDRIGMIVFAGDAYVQMPITSDNVSAKMFLSTISPNLVPRPGTAIGSAIDLAINSFGTIENNNMGRAIVLITDGENHEDDAVKAAQLAQSKGIKVNVVGMGHPEGSPIPIEGSMSFHRDKNGEVVVSKLNEAMCQQIAAAGKGVYVRADNTGAALRALSREIDSMQKGDLETQSYSDYDERFYVLGWLALLLLIAEFFILGRQNKQLNKIHLFEHK